MSKACGEVVVIAGMSHLLFRCTRDANHGGQPHSIHLGPSLLKKIKTVETVKANWSGER